MSLSSLPRTVVGVDGCKAGWVCVAARPGEPPHVAVHGDFASLVASFPADAVIAIDMPIGLPDIGEAGGRVAERAARILPGVRKSSVFSIPSRRAVYAETGRYASQSERLAAHKRAGIVARATSVSASSFSIQTFCILPKIRQIDDLLKYDTALRERLIESHPEVAFASLNGGFSIEKKKTVAGVRQRTEILVAHGFDQQFLTRKTPPKVGVDDFLDAACMMIVAAHKVLDQAVPNPSPLVHDGFGIPVAIWTVAPRRDVPSIRISKPVPA